MNAYTKCLSDVVYHVEDQAFNDSPTINNIQSLNDSPGVKATGHAENTLYTGRNSYSLNPTKSPRLDGSQMTENPRTDSHADPELGCCVLDVHASDPLYDWAQPERGCILACSDLKDAGLNKGQCVPQASEPEGTVVPWKDGTSALLVDKLRAIANFSGLIAEILMLDLRGALPTLTLNHVADVLHHYALLFYNSKRHHDVCRQYQHGSHDSSQCDCDAYFLEENLRTCAKSGDAGKAWVFITVWSIYNLGRAIKRICGHA